jgi:Fanconi-associated nuclease 1
VYWDNYEMEQVKDIASCLGGKSLGAICKLLAEDYRSWGAGMPDLLLWKPVESKK